LVVAVVEATAIVPVDLVADAAGSLAKVPFATVLPRRAIVTDEAPPGFRFTTSVATDRSGFDESVAAVDVKQGTGSNKIKMGKTGVPLRYHKRPTSSS
jgi:hypothetical protein